MTVEIRNIGIISCRHAPFSRCNAVQTAVGEACQIQAVFRQYGAVMGQVIHGEYGVGHVVADIDVAVIKHAQIGDVAIVFFEMLFDEGLHGSSVRCGEGFGGGCRLVPISKQGNGLTVAAGDELKFNIFGQVRNESRAVNGDSVGFLRCMDDDVFIAVRVFVGNEAPQNSMFPVAQIQIVATVAGIGHAFGDVHQAVGAVFVNVVLYQICGGGLFVVLCDYCEIATVIAVVRLQNCERACGLTVWAFLEQRFDALVFHVVCGVESIVQFTQWCRGAHFINCGFLSAAQNPELGEVAIEAEVHNAFGGCQPHNLFRKTGQTVICDGFGTCFQCRENGAKLLIVFEADEGLGHVDPVIACFLQLRFQNVFGFCV